MTASAIRYSPLASLSVPRIGAWSASLSIHAIVIGFMLSAPVAYTLVQKAAPEVPTIVTIVEPKPVAVVEELTPPPMTHTKAPPVRHPAPALQPVQNPIRTAVSEPPVEVQTAPPTDISTSTTTAAPPDVAPTALAYNLRTAVAYPKESLHLREQGTVLLRVLVDVDGKVIAVEIERSSGSSRLDRAARDAVKAWSFNPARHAGVAQQAWARVPISFTLSAL